MTAIADVVSGKESLSAGRCIEILTLMVRARAMELRMIQMSKSEESHFWIGGPGEEAFNVCLGLQVRKGQGPAYDYLHLHYRNSATLLAMGMPMLDALRQSAMTRTDPHSMGRNFVGHYARPEWNVLPVSSVVETQYAIAPGTAWVQRRQGGHGVTIVIGGDAGTAEGDFATCLIWSSRPGQQLPVLMVVMNNQWGISTATPSQQNLTSISQRGAPFDIPGETVDGNDPILSWSAIHRALHWCRTRRRPYLLEARVSRLHGHSSSSGAARTYDEPDCVALFQQRLIDSDILAEATAEQIWHAAHQEAEEAWKRVMNEPAPTADDVRKHTYSPSSVDKVYPHDFTGLPD